MVSRTVVYLCVCVSTVYIDVCYMCAHALSICTTAQVLADVVLAVVRVIVMRHPHPPAVAAPPRPAPAHAPGSSCRAQRTGPPHASRLRGGGQSCGGQCVVKWGCMAGSAKGEAPWSLTPTGPHLTSSTDPEHHRYSYAAKVVHQVACSRIIIRHGSEALHALHPQSSAWSFGTPLACEDIKLLVNLQQLERGACAPAFFLGLPVVHVSLVPGGLAHLSQW